MSTVTRRQLLAAAASAPLAPLALSRDDAAAHAPSQTTMAPPPRYALAANLELMFPQTMPHAQRMEMIAAQGIKAFGFWSSVGKDHKAMLDAQQRLGLACCSITGTTDAGRKTGLTHTGYEAEFLKDFQNNCERAKLFGCPNLISFLGASTTAVPPDIQHRQFIEGLKKAGDIAAKYGVYFCLEALNPIDNPTMSVLSATHAFKIVADVNHPHVLVDFDMYHLAMGEGNIINNLRKGLRNKWIRFVEIGDVPGRKEPGTGETNYDNIFKVLREEGFDNFVGMEHGTSSTPEHAMQVVRRVAGV